MAIDMWLAFSPLDLCRALAVQFYATAPNDDQRRKGEGMIRAVHSLDECPHEPWALEVLGDGRIVGMR